MSHHDKNGRSAPSLYGLAWRRILFAPGTAVAFVLAAAVLGAAQGGLGWVAASLGKTLLSTGTGGPLPLGSLGSLSASDLALLGVGVALVKALAAPLATLSQVRIATEAADRLRLDTVLALLDRGLATPSPHAVAVLTSRIREVESSLQDGVLASVRALAQLVPLGVALLATCPPLAAAAAIVAVPFALALEAARRRWRAMHARAMGSDDALHEEIDDLVRHTDLWRAFGSGHHVANVVRERGSEAARARARAEAARTALSASNEVLAALALALAVMLASRLPGSAGGATLVAFAAIFFMAYRPLRDLGDARSWVSRGERALRELGEVAACVTETRRRPQLRAVAGQAGDTTLEVRDLAVGERCPPVSFRLRPGECVVVLGRTGAGKTTLARALLGLEPEARGSVRLGGRRLEPGEVGPEARRMAWVPQEAPVVSGTLEQNVGLIGGTARGARAELALLGASDLGDRIAHVKLGAAGRGLSGGERRWISLARALSTGLPVLVLDEPTSGLDEASRRRVLQVLAAMRGRRSLVVVTHDADVLALADQVLQIGGGQDARPAPALGPRPDHRGLRGPRPSATSRS